MRILLIGAYGFIGSEIASALKANGHTVVGFGRSAGRGRLLVPDIDWVAGDLRRLARPEDWTGYLSGIDAVVNASGALQGTLGEKLQTTQGDSIIALIDACERTDVRRFIQISAPGAISSDASPFLMTKGIADTRLRRSSLQWAILRPGLVIGRNAFGGTLLLRSLAATPWAVVTVHGHHLVQTVAMEDVTAAVCRCLAPDCPMPVDADLVAPASHRLDDLILRHRAWLAIRPPRRVWNLSAGYAAPVRWAADLLGQFGWRSPLRSTAMDMIARDVRGSSTDGETLLGKPLLSLGETLARHRSGSQDRWQARLFLLLPLIIGSLALLWLSSGIIGLCRIDAVAAELAGTAASPVMARWMGIAGGMIDVLLGGAILIRRWARSAAFGMVMVTISYLVAGTFLRPDLWLDPLAPLVKAVPAMVLALVTHALLDER